MPGPLPDPNHRRRNAPTIPGTALPAAGRPGPPPAVPSWITLGASGMAWWKWAWKTPQAAAWSEGHVVAVARRAGIEDDLALLRDAPELNVADLLDIEEDERTTELEWLIRGLHRLATGKLALEREARELDDRLGLTPKGFSALRWTIAAPEEQSSTPAPTARKSRSRKLRVVDGKAS